MHKNRWQRVIRGLPFWRENVCGPRRTEWMRVRFTPKWQILRSTWPTWWQEGRPGELATPRPGRAVQAYAAVCGMDALLTGLVFLLDFHYDRVNIAMLYLIPVVIAAAVYGLWPGVFAACLGLMSFDFFFVPPIFSYAVSDLRFLVSFAVFLVVAITTAGLASTMRRRAEEASQRARIAQTLFRMSRALTAAMDEAHVVQTALEQVRELWQTHAYIALKRPTGFDLRALPGDEADPVIDRQVLDWVLRHGDLASFGSKAHGQAAFLYVPIRAQDEVYGAFVVGEPGQFRLATRGEIVDILRAMANLVAIALSRIASEERARLADVAAESERVRTAILNSISHELRTPITTMLGASEALMDPKASLDPADRRELVLTLRNSALRMNRLVANLIGMARIEGGLLVLNRRPSDLADLIRGALREVSELTADHPVRVQAPDPSPIAEVDEALFQQALVNLLSNAAKYSPPGAPIDVLVTAQGTEATVEVRDYGMGIPEDEVDRVFDKFYRGRSVQSLPGTGLGLAIVRAVVEAHGWKIEVKRMHPGTAFRIRLEAREAPKEAEHR
ncbi:DUF4118 domain-containing protein [Alicyclobacillus vulcanalis]|uniref:histidine kinase n=1 Tax=Alicyclobacillus vulcanalis TaxID=252246 RepID=A0A1N7PMW2_9BACL|nr:DUF4118 domain-containing protein [Alicyclobacillus vulcanalis]SIT11965.1 two-component system, OmpR family, sensor histidine kinase KdpD [Alicyclobacillus vulcanalis]